MYTRARKPDAGQRVASLAVDEELRDLEVDGYKVVFTTRVALMPVALVDVKPAERDSRDAQQ